MVVADQRTLSPPNRSLVGTFDVSPGGESIVLGQRADDGHAPLTLWSLGHLRQTGEVDADTPFVPMARFVDGGSKLAYVTQRLEARLVSLDGGETTEPFDVAHARWLSAAREGPNVVVAGELTRVFDARDGTAVWALPGQRAPRDPERPPAVGALSDDGRHIAVAGLGDGRLEVHDLVRGERLQELEGGPEHARWIAFDAEQRLAAAVEWDSRGAFVWDLESGKPVATDVFGPEREGYVALALHPGGRLVGAGRRSGWVEILDLRSEAFVLDERAHDQRVTEVGFSADGKHFLSSGADGNVHIWNLEGGKRHG